MAGPGSGYSHVVEVGDLALLVGNDGEVDARARHLVNVLDPALVAVERVGRQADDLDAALGKLGLDLGHGPELRRAHGRVVLRVREEHDPAVADELVEIDGSLRGLGLEVGRLAAQAEAVARPEDGLSAASPSTRPMAVRRIVAACLASAPESGC